MKKIYMVVADNGQSYEDHDHWNVRAFTSEEAAQAFIKSFDEEIGNAISRSHELERLENDRKLTDDEKEEYGRLCELAYDYTEVYYVGHFRIEDHELYE